MLRGTALRLLPGFCQARNQLDLVIDVLGYFAREAERELTTGKIRVHAIDPQISRQLGVMQSLISAFTRGDIAGECDRGGASPVHSAESS
jgi:hypothetical protein